MTYKQAYDKIIEAYFRDEIQPMKSCFCFCGTLCGNNNRWNHGLSRPEFGYTWEQFKEMENSLFIHLKKLDNHWVNWDSHPKYETALFAGMSDALDVLKQIHIERGEVIDETPAFTKRELA